MWESHGSRVSVQNQGKRARDMLCCRVTCGTEGDECLRVFADHRQLVFGEGEPAYDVLDEIIGDDRGHIPLQLPQHDQLPVLKKKRKMEDRS